MKNINQFLIVVLMLILNQNIFSQKHSFYLKIDDPILIPELIRYTDRDDIGINAKTQELQSFYEYYEVSRFEQAFPTAASSWLRSIYIVTTSNMEFGKEIKAVFPEKVSLVEYIDDSNIYVTGEPYCPNDYGMEYNQTNLDLINAKKAWSIAKDLPKIEVAITDTYFDLQHEDLDFIGYNGNNNPNVAYAYHGTQVSGALAALTDNGIGISSIGFDTPLYVSSFWANDQEVHQLAQDGYRVINCSWINRCDYSQVQDSLYEEIRNDWNTIVVAGAGNSTAHCGSLEAKVYPASYNSVVSVTSVGHIHDIGYYHPIYGPADWKDVHEMVAGDTTSSYHHNEAVNICAPGYHVGSTYITGTGISGGNYGATWGTSIAAPHVAGVAALILSINPCLNANEAVDILLQTADSSIYDIQENQRYIGKLGTGRLDAYAACQEAAETATVYLQEQTIVDSNHIKSNYAIKVLGDVIIENGAEVLLTTRKEIELNGPFEVQIGAVFEVNVNLYNQIYCP